MEIDHDRRVEIRFHGSAGREQECKTKNIPADFRIARIRKHQTQTFVFREV
jgi:hypothetical protein